MTATVMDGRSVAAEIRERLRHQVQQLHRRGVEPFLATVLVGDDPASRLYVGNKHKAAAEVGIRTENHTLPVDTTEATLSNLIDELNHEKRVHGILLQLPLPPQLDPLTIVEKISPQKDVDGLTSANMGKLFYNQQSLPPCTPMGVMTLLHHYGIKIRGANTVVINRSSLVGKPLFHLLLAEDATVTTCHSKSVDISKITSQADILITAVGRRPQFLITADMVKIGAVVVDVAMNNIAGKWCGDADFDAVSAKASYITPVPGGVGPMTIAMLMQNTVTATVNQAGARTT